MDELLTYTEAAALCGVDETTVRQWRSRHYLTPAHWDGQRLLFRREDVLAADEKARSEPRGRKRKKAA